MSKLEKLKTLIPLETLEYEAQSQIYDALDLDFLIKLAIMPDCHTGYSLPIGGVALLERVISPAYVGYDVGCGMCFIILPIKTNDFFKTQESKLKFFEEVYKIIPVGFTSREESISYLNFKSASEDKNLTDKVNSKLYIQLGTLGSGNHFIEIGENLDGYITITVHSGSRNPGHSIGNYYMKLSNNVDKNLPKGFLNLDGEYGQQYLQDMNFFLDYALENRKIMMKKVLSLFGYNNTYAKELDSLIKNMVNENHNHAIVIGDTVLHRKGATPANKDQRGIIPGSMKTGVYLTEGLGNDEYLSSASHGAGRKMSRGKAKKNIKLEVFKEQMKGIIAKVGKSTLDEAPDAYKNLHEVIEKQEGIVIKTIDYAKPIIGIKG